MRRIRYLVASSLDGYIAGANGEADWITIDPEIDFGAMFAQFDTMVMGRGTYQAMTGEENPPVPSMKTYVVSRTLRQEDHPKVTILSDPRETLIALREGSGKDIFLFGGGSLFRSAAELGLVDTVEVAIIPILLGGGIPLLLPPTDKIPLKLSGHRLYEKSGIMLLEYEIVRKFK